MGKIKQKLQKKVIEKYGKVINDASEGLTDIIIKRDDLNQAIKNIDKINGYFEFFYSKIILMFEYLRDDFNIDVDYEGDNINEELQKIEEHYKRFKNKTINNKWLNKVNLRKYKKAINKWYSVNNAMDVLPPLIKFWMEKTDLEMYKDINIENIQDKLNEAHIYKKSFAYYKQFSENHKLQ